MRVEIIDQSPQHILVLDKATGKKLKLGNQFFKKRYEAGMIEVDNIKKFQPHV